LKDGIVLSNRDPCGVPDPRLDCAIAPYGHQRGALRPNLRVIRWWRYFLLYGWQRNGNCGTARPVVELLKNLGVAAGNARPSPAHRHPVITEVFGTTDPIAEV